LTLTIDSSRFGRVEIDPATVIEFPDGLIGLSGSRYALLARDEESAFAWLQSLNDPALALPVTNPHRFFAGYEVKLTDEDAERVGAGERTAMDVYVTVRAGQTLADFTANLKAPIVVRDGRGWQVINQADGSQLRAPLFAEVEIEAGGG
jgi:flagellar assembly factor FliW